MNKYNVYRLLDDNRELDREAELVAVEFGNSIRDVTPALIKDVNADLAAMPEHKGCRTVAFEPLEACMYENRYPMQGVVMPTKADENILIDYEIEEIPAQSKDYQFV